MNHDLLLYDDFQDPPALHTFTSPGTLLLRPTLLHRPTQAQKRGKNSSPKRPLNCRKASKTKGSASNGRKWVASRNPRIVTRKTPINKGLKNPKHDKRASQVRDGWLTVLDFRVPFLLELKITGMQFLKAPKKRGNASKKTPKNRGLKPTKKAESPLKQRTKC
jgi:hypothetical protein